MIINGTFTYMYIYMYMYVRVTRDTYHKACPKPGGMTHIQRQG